MAQFVDRATLHLQAGDGGHGCVSVHREKFKPLGGPDGGNGGHGGDIILEVSTQVHTLLDFQYRPHVKAKRGGNGAGDWRNGARGEDLVLEVPVGTVVRSEEGEVLASPCLAPASSLQKAVSVGWAMLRWLPPSARHRASRSRVNRAKRWT